LGPPAAINLRKAEGVIKIRGEEYGNMPAGDGRLMDAGTATAGKGRLGANRIFYLLAGISLLLVAAIAADGVRKGLNTIVPAYYRHLASLSIAISELAHGTSDMVGLVEVDKALQASGYSLDPAHDRTGFLNTHTAEADAALRAAADLKIADRSNTFGLRLNETGMIDYYHLAFRLFGYHVRAIYALYIGILALLALCFIVTFRHRAIFIVPSIIYLLLLLADQHGLKANDYGFGPLTNSRLLPFLSLYPVLFCLTLIGSGRGIRWIDATALSYAGLVFGFVVNARIYSLWQIGPLIALVVLIPAARTLPWRPPLKAAFARLSLYPAFVFALCAAILISIHHERRDSTVYATTTFGGHGYWLTYIGTTLPFFMSRIPELERESGVKIDSSDAYVGALLRIKIKERGGTLDEYMTRDGWWDDIKREQLARQITFDMWRNYPGVMIENYVRSFAPLADAFLKGLGLIALALAAVSIGPPTLLFWLARAAVLIAVGGIAGAAALAAASLRYVLPSARRLSALIIPVALLALATIPTILVMPFTDTRLVSSSAAFIDPRMADVDDAVWLALLIFACGVRWQLPAAVRLWNRLRPLNLRRPVERA
jgi:hypothetical protein